MSGVQGNLTYHPAVINASKSSETHGLEGDDGYTCPICKGKSNSIYVPIEHNQILDEDGKKIDCPNKGKMHYQQKSPLKGGKRKSSRKTSRKSRKNRRKSSRRGRK